MEHYRPMTGALCAVFALASCLARGQVAREGAVRLSLIDCSAEQFVAEGMPQARAQTRGFGAVFTVLADMGIEATDMSADAQAGVVQLGDADLLIVRKLTALTRASLADNADLLAEFVAAGGTVVQVTATDQEQQVVDWLPEPLGAMITDLDFSRVHIEDPEHPLFSTPNPLTAAEMRQITQQLGQPAAAAAGAAGAPPPTSPVSWESFQGFREAKLLLTNRGPGRVGFQAIPRPASRTANGTKEQGYDHRRALKLGTYCGPAGSRRARLGVRAALVR